MHFVILDVFLLVFPFVWLFIHDLLFFLLGKLEIKATVKKLFEVCRKFEQESDWEKYIRAVE